MILKLLSKPHKPNIYIYYKLLKKYSNKPTLKEIAKKWLSIPESLVSPERLFTILGSFCGRKRKQLESIWLEC